MAASALSADYTGSSVFIYDLDGNHLANTRIVSHDKTEKQIQVALMPQGLRVNDECKLFIVASPAPCEYQGKVKRFGGTYTIAMYQGQVKEKREATRYKVNSPAILSAYVAGDDQRYELLNPITVKLINISTSGMRFRAPYNSLTKGDKFQISMTVSGGEKSLIGEVINFLDNKTESTDYGCRFINN